MVYSLSVVAGVVAVAQLASAQLGQIKPISQWGGSGKSLSPAYTWFYQYPLPIAGVAQPTISTTIGGQKIDFYNTTIVKFQQQIYPNLGPANLIGYNGTAPGPTLRIKKNTHTVHRFINYGDVSAAVHLHGSATRSPWDGWASDTIEVGQFKDYYYPNTQNARTLWYHDHANGHTATDAYYGQTGVHIIYDPAEDRLHLPSGKYDIPLLIADKVYGSNGDLVSPEGNTFNFFGDVIQVNGQPWPYLAVEPRKYRLRVLNAALSRPFQLYLLNAANAVQTFSVIGSDSGLFNAPVSTSTLDLGMGERYEIIVDFAQYRGTNVTMMNSLNLPGILDYQNTDKIMRFVVGTSTNSTVNNMLPSSLVSVDFPPTRNTIDHTFAFQHNQVNWTINGVVFDDVQSRVLAQPPVGTVENWKFIYESGPSVHPIHLHLIDFKIISRTGGRGAVMPYESAGLKDVVLLAPGETVQVNAIYGPWNGLYMFHCHNLIHEDHEMMAVFNVTGLEYLANLGYKNVLKYDNPMDPRYLAKDVSPQYLNNDYVSNTLLPNLARSGAYKTPKKLAAAEAAYYVNHPYGENVTTTALHAQELVAVTYETIVTQGSSTDLATFVGTGTVATTSKTKTTKVKTTAASTTAAAASTTAPLTTASATVASVLNKRRNRWNGGE